MTPVMQTKLYSADGIHNGNCWAAALASLLDLPLWMVPPWEDMFGRGGGVYMDRTEEWLSKILGLQLVMLGGHQVDKLAGKSYIASGRSLRGVLHAVIYHDGKLVHDPHPSGSGILTVETTHHLEPVKP